MVPDSSELQAEAGGAEGMSREGVERTWGPLSPKPALWGPRAGRPPPPTAGPGGAVTQELDRPAQLRARPPPPSCLNLDPASGDPAPPPPAGAGLGLPAGERPALGVRGGLP